MKAVEDGESNLNSIHVVSLLIYLENLNWTIFWAKFQLISHIIVYGRVTIYAPNVCMCNCMHLTLSGINWRRDHESVRRKEIVRYAYFQEGETEPTYLSPPVIVPEKNNDVGWLLLPYDEPEDKEPDTSDMSFSGSNYDSHSDSELL